jgi:lipoate-protein ligase A
MDKLQRYLSPSKAKLAAKGVASVRSRVINLQELNPALTCDIMKDYMARAFAEVYGMQPQKVHLDEKSMAEIQETAKLYGSWDYLYGTPLPFSFSCEERFDWGQIRLELQAINGTIIGVKAYSDSMDWQISARVEQALTGCTFRLKDMVAALRNALPAETAEDLCQLLQQQNL